jgi:hypothetical protein
VGRHLDGGVEEADGRGAAGNGGRRGRPAADAGMGAGRGRRRPRQVGPTRRWLREREREGRRARWWALSWLGRGIGPGWFVRLVMFLFFLFFFFFLFFSNPFQTNFKPFKFKFFTCFQIQILTQIFQLF